MMMSWKIRGFLAALFCVALISVAAVADAALRFHTTSFSARVKLSDHRTATIDATIQIAIDRGGSGAVGKLQIAVPSVPGVKYLVSKATLSAGGTNRNVKVAPDAAGNLIASLDDPSLTAALSATLEVNYIVLGPFAEHAGGTLGDRSTLTWSVIPSSWPSQIDAVTCEIEFPKGIDPLYLSGTVNPTGNRITVEKTGAGAFTGSTASINVTESAGVVTLKPMRPIGPRQEFRIIAALPKGALKPAPASLEPEAPAAPPPPRTQGAHRTTEMRTVQVNPSRPAAHREVPLWPAMIPILAPVLFFFFNLRKFTFMTGRAYANSAVPSGMGPAEAGYLLDGRVHARHLLGAITDLTHRGVLKLTSSPTGQSVEVVGGAVSNLGPVDQVIIRALGSPNRAVSLKEAKGSLDNSRGELEGRIGAELANRDLTMPQSSVRLIQGAALLLAIAIASLFTYPGRETEVLIAAVVSVAVGGFLVFSLSPLTRKGMATFEKLVGLRKFLFAEAQGLRQDTSYLPELQGYAVALGVVRTQDDN